MRTSKKFLSLLLALLLVLGLTACASCQGQTSESEKGNVAAGVTELEAPAEDTEETEEVPEETEPEEEPEEQEEEPTEAPEEPEEEAEEDAEESDDPLTLTLEERAKGTKIYFPLGAKYTMPELYNENSNYVYRRHLGFEPGVSKFIKFSREQYFRFDGKDEAKKAAYEGKDIDYFDFPLFGVFNLKKDEIPADHSEMQEFMGFPNLEKLREDDDYVQYFGYGDYNQAPVDELEEEDRALYKNLLNKVTEIKDGLYAFRPMELDESIGGVKNWTFETQHLDGTPADESIFKDKDVTLVSYMTTWCPFCIEELPEFQKATDTYLKEKNGQVIALFADIVPDEKDKDGYDYEGTKAKAAELLTDVGATFPAIENSYSVDNSLGKYAMNYPTNFFVDKDGNVLDVNVGSYEDLEAAFDRAIALANGEDPEAMADDESEDADDADEATAFENYKDWPTDKKLTDGDIETILADPELTLTPEERDENYEFYAVVGAKLKLSGAFADEFAPYRRRHRGFGSTPNDLIRMSREYYYYAQNPNNEDAYLDYPLFGLFVLNKTQVPEDEEALKEELGFQILKKTYEDADTVQYFAKGQYNEDVSETDKKAYENLYNELDEIEDSLYAFPALDLSQTIGKTRNWEFKTINHAGETVTQDIFKDADITLVSYMTTWCPHCKNEVPVLEKVAKEKGDKFQVVYIVADANGDFGDPENLKKAQAALDELYKDYDNVQARILYNSISIDDSLGKFAMNFPTNFFVDRMGNVVGEIYLGGFDEASLLDELQERLRLTHTK